MPEQTVIEAVRDTMRAEMRRDESVILLGEDVGLRGGVFLATDGFIEEFGEDRVIDTPLAESLICGLALGAAVNGMRPLAEIQFADFVWPAINQLVGEAARVRYGTNGVKTAPMTIRVPYGGGVRGGLYHSQSIEVLFAHTPGLTVVAPATPYDAKGLLASAIRSDDPVIVLEHKRTYRLVKGEVPIEDYTTLNARNAAVAVRELDLVGLAKVAKYEAANKNRKTVFQAIDRRRTVLAKPPVDIL